MAEHTNHECPPNITDLYLRHDGLQYDQQPLDQKSHDRNTDQWVSQKTMPTQHLGDESAKHAANGQITPEWGCRLIDVRCNTAQLVRKQRD